jgi:hypothetical protein
MGGDATLFAPAALTAASTVATGPLAPATAPEDMAKNVDVWFGWWRCWLAGKFKKRGKQLFGYQGSHQRHPTANLLTHFYRFAQSRRARLPALHAYSVPLFSHRVRATSLILVLMVSWCFV